MSRQSAHESGKVCHINTKRNSNVAKINMTNLCKGLVWFGLFVHPFSLTCNTGHVNYRLQFTTHLVIYRHPHNTM